MKLAIIGSRGITDIDLSALVGDEVTEIVSGGAKGIDSLTAEYAEQNQIKLTVFLPDYKKFGRGAPIKRNYEIVDYSDEVLAIWDGASRGTKSVIDYCQKICKKVRVIIKNQ